MVHTTQAPATVAVSAQLNSTGATARVHGPQRTLRRNSTGTTARVHGSQHNLRRAQTHFSGILGQISCAKLIAVETNLTGICAGFSNHSATSTTG